jgi:hypothetical protein
MMTRPPLRPSSAARLGTECKEQRFCPLMAGAAHDPARFRHRFTSATRCFLSLSRHGCHLLGKMPSRASDPTEIFPYLA